MAKEMSVISYDAPSYAYLLLFSAVIGFVLWRLFVWRQRVLSKFVSAKLLARVVLVRDPFWFTVHAAFLVMIWSLAVIALMQPKGNPRENPHLSQERLVLEEELGPEQGGQDQKVLSRKKSHDVVFLMDTSLSMSISDTRLGSDRLSLGKEIVEEVVRSMEGENVALYAFTSEVRTVVPATLDYLFFRLMLANIGFNEPDVAGTNLLNALEVVKEKHFPARQDKLVTLVVLTDGGDTRLETLSGEGRAKEIEAISSRIAGAEGLNLRVFTVGLGTKEGEVIPNISFEGNPVVSSLDEPLLSTLAEKGRGEYYFANDLSALTIAQDIVRRLRTDDPIYSDDERSQNEEVLTRKTLQDEPERVYDEYFQIPLFIAVVLLSLHLVLPENKGGLK